MSNPGGRRKNLTGALPAGGIATGRSLPPVHKAFGFMAAIILVAMLLIVYSGVGWAMRDKPYATDFFKFYESGARLLSHESVYWDVTDRMVPGNPCNEGSLEYLDLMLKSDSGISSEEVMRCLHPNLNPPLFAILTAPFAYLDYKSAWLVWSSASVVCAFLALLLMIRTMMTSIINNKTYCLLIIFGFFAYFPTLANFAYGQVASFVLLPLTLAWLAMRRGYDLAAGLLLGFIASLKVFFGLFVLVFLFNRKWRATAGFATSWVALFALSIVIAGPQSYQQYLTSIQKVSWLGASWNASFSGFYTRIFGGSENVPLFDAVMLGKALTVMSCLVVMGLLYRVVRDCTGLLREQAVDLTFAAVVPAMLLISPLGWIYYFQLLLVSVIVISRYTIGLTCRLTCMLIIFLCLILTAVPRMLLPSLYVDEPMEIFWDAGGYMYSLIALFLLVVYVAHKQSRLSAEGKASGNFAQ